VDRPLAAAMVLGILGMLLGLMWLGWRSLKRRSSKIPAPDPIPAAAADEVLSRTGWYVATTHAGRPLERIAVRGLAFRAAASISVTTGGIELRLSGGTECFIPAGRLRLVERASWTIDRAVERGGLVVVGWRLGTVPDDAVDVDTYLRVDDPGSLAEAIATLIPVPEGRKLA
jgi:hypothetical protein